MKRIAALLVLAGICAGMDCEGNMPAAMPAPDPVDTDTDGDGLTDAEEALIGTSRFFTDTDADGLSDGDEVSVFGTDPSNPDTDFDGLTDGLELDPNFGSDPLIADTDGDGFLDGDEIALGLDLLSPNPVGTVVDVYCDDFIAVGGVVGNVVGVYERSDFLGGFTFGFQPGQLVALAAEGIPGDLTGSIRANLATGETGFFSWLGERSALGGTIVGVVPTAISISISLSNGLGFEVNSFDVSETNDWFLGDFVEIVLPRDPSDPLSSSKMLNVDACEIVLLSP